MNNFKHIIHKCNKNNNNNNNNNNNTNNNHNKCASLTEILLSRLRVIGIIVHF